MSDVEENYSDLYKKFAERSRHAKLIFDKDKEEDFDELDDQSYDDEKTTQNLNYTFTTGDRLDGELMWVADDESLYVSNGKIVKTDNSEAFTCSVNKCTARVYLKPNGIAYKVAEHTVNHGSMYQTYKKFQCRSFMREECMSAGASKTPSDIYEAATRM